MNIKEFEKTVSEQMLSEAAKGEEAWFYTARPATFIYQQFKAAIDEDKLREAGLNVSFDTSGAITAVVRPLSTHPCFNPYWGESQALRIITARVKKKKFARQGKIQKELVPAGIECFQNYGGACLEDIHDYDQALKVAKNMEITEYLIRTANQCLHQLSLGEALSFKRTTDAMRLLYSHGITVAEAEAAVNTIKKAHFWIPYMRDGVFDMRDDVLNTHDGVFMRRESVALKNRNEATMVDLLECGANVFLDEPVVLAMDGLAEGIRENIHAIKQAVGPSTEMQRKMDYTTGQVCVMSRTADLEAIYQLYTNMQPGEYRDTIFTKFIVRNAFTNAVSIQKMPIGKFFEDYLPKMNTIIPWAKDSGCCLLYSDEKLEMCPFHGIDELKDHVSNAATALVAFDVKKQ